MTNHYTKLLSLLFLFSAMSSISLASDNIISIAQGKLRGVIENESLAFKGIPFAAPPTGDNRWRPPQPPSGWKGVRDATNYANDCAQEIFPFDAAPLRTEPREDCLYLNIWRPLQGNATSKFPVMVWIHGGGFVNGGTSPAIYSGEAFARDGVVLVSINYRLGRYGFFAHPGLEAEGFGGNFAFLDQIAALEWVRDNISAFGGDSNNVTVFGESAGGMSVHMLLQTPLARGLFHKAIIESGGGRQRTMPMATLSAGAKKAIDFAPGLTAAQLRALPEEKVTGDLSLMTAWKGGYSGPMIDGKTILGSSLESAEAGFYAKVPVIIGANSADGFSMAPDKQKILAAFGEAEDRARELYDPDGSTPDSIVGAMTSADRMFIEPARAVARALADKQPVFYYRFAYAVPEWLKNSGGMPHAREIPYVFDTVQYRHDMKMIEEEQAVATLAHHYWVNFAKTGRPDKGVEVPVWPTATPEANSVQIIDADGARNTEDPYRERLDFTEQLP